MRVYVASRQNIGSIIGDRNSLLISITTTDGKHPEVRGNWGEILRLKFDDVDSGIQQFQPFASWQAREIFGYVIAFNPGTVVVNCDAGLSRSAGVAVGLEETINANKFAYKQYPLLNRYVLGTMRKIWHGGVKKEWEGLKK